MVTEILKPYLEEHGALLSEKQLSQLESYARLLTEWNEKMNLTAITDPVGITVKHFADSLAAAPLLPAGEFTLIDVGTGAGFPGMVLKILEPSIRLTLLDSLDKRVGFLRDVCERLGFDDVECVHARAEDAAHGRRESYDFAVARAVARLELLCELCLPFVRVGGKFIAMKGPDCADEVSGAARAVSLLGGRLAPLMSYTVPDTDAVRSLVIIEKLLPTPEKYPRRWAQIKKSPL